MNLLLAAALLIGSGDPQYPRQAGLVNDFAGALDASSKEKVQALCDGLLKSKKFVLVVVTVPSLQERSVEEFTVGLANTWKIGQKKKDNGVVFLVAPSEKKLRIENGYGTETTLTDLETKHIIDRIILPRMKEGKTGEGVVAGTEALVAKLGGAEIPKGLEAPEEESHIVLWVGIAIGIILVICIFSAVSLGNPFAWILLLDTSSSGSSSSSSSSSDSDSGSGGGSFGGGGASGSW